MPSAGPRAARPVTCRSASPLACPPKLGAGREARRWVRWSAGPLVLLAAALLLRADSVATGSQPASAFASTVASLSERGGYFDTDNLISNERSYLQVIPDLRERGVRGGAYIGVGPDQNFSYISEVRPAVAYIIDVRRDNMLLHLLFKALFEVSRQPHRLPRASARPAAAACRRRLETGADRPAGRATSRKRRRARKS